MPADRNRQPRGVVPSRLVIALLAMLLALAAIGPAAHAAGLYVSLGDSVAAGFGASDPSRGGYPARLFAILRTPLGGGLSEWSNRALGGETSTSLRGAQLSEAIADIDAPSDTRVVTIDIGGNDRAICAGAWYLPSCPFAANFAATLRDLQSALASDPGAEDLVAMAYYNPNSGLGPPTEPDIDRGLLGSDLRIDCLQSGDRLGLNDLIFCISGAQGAEVADAYPPFKAGGQALIADSLHPNDAGHAVLARTFCLTLRSVPDSACSAVPPPPPPPPSPPPPPPDHTGPQIAISGLRGTGRRCVRRSFVVQIRARDPIGVRRVRVYLDRRLLRSTRSSRLRVRVPARLRRGRHRLTVLARDGAGNRSRRSVRFRSCGRRA
ncbi:MAG TPA: SGNH/GDSL hydrolase family protein [Thermoleophilaceae bacterium]|jgi:lysophospholipase L1-like esterase|nr:SGNH/GDSL hydrolase family protein [Thermoleophilaceae bacterium]